jgi:hypothetical protein
MPVMAGVGRRIESEREDADHVAFRAAHIDASGPAHGLKD